MFQEVNKVSYSMISTNCAVREDVQLTNCPKFHRCYLFIFECFESSMRILLHSKLWANSLYLDDRAI